jgi:hypothetical protein
LQSVERVEEHFAREVLQRERSKRRNAFHVWNAMVMTPLHKSSTKQIPFSTIRFDLHSEHDLPAGSPRNPSNRHQVTT